MSDLKPLFKNKQGGVSLLEVLISIVVIAVGVMGLAKLQASSISSTQVSGTRGLVALQAASLAATMHSNRGYWQVSGTPNCNGASSCQFTGTSATYFGTVPTTCTYANPCSTSAIAALDMSNWMATMNTLVPTYSLNITCTDVSGQPTSCILTIKWTEKQSGSIQTTTGQTASATESSTTQSFFLYVIP